MRLAVFKLIFKIIRRLRARMDLPSSRKHFDRSARIIFRTGCRFSLKRAGTVPCEWIPGPAVAAERVLFYLHGGAFISGSPRSHRHLVCRISRACLSSALVPDYRLAPEFPFPAALEDSTAAYSWLLEEGYAPSRMALMGDSAGGGLCLKLLQRLRDRRIPMPACAVLLSPWTDLSCSGASWESNAGRDPMFSLELGLQRASLYAGKQPLESPDVSPLFGDLSRLPPLLLQVSEDEVLLDDSRRLANGVRESGGEVELQIWPRTFHVWHYLASFFPEGMRAVDEIARFVSFRIPG